MFYIYCLSMPIKRHAIYNGILFIVKVKHVTCYVLQRCCLLHLLSLSPTPFLNNSNNNPSKKTKEKGKKYLKFKNIYIRLNELNQ
jgi:hypothetical protein